MTTQTRHYRRWTPQEDAELLSSVGTRKLTTTARELDRTVDATRRRASLIGLNTPNEGRRAAGMSMADVAREMGVQSNRVLFWIARGWLPTHTGYGVHMRYISIDPYDLSGFLAERGALLPYLRPADLAWREEIAQARAALLARYIDSVAMRKMLHWSRGTRAYVTSRLGFRDVATLSIGDRYPTWYDRASLRNWLVEHEQYLTTEARRCLK